MLVIARIGIFYIEKEKEKTKKTKTSRGNVKNENGIPSRKKGKNRPEHEEDSSDGMKEL